MSRPPAAAPGTVRVSPLDVLHAHSRVAVVVGPVALPDVRTATERLHALVSLGPHTRLGLTPSTTTTDWKYDPEAVPEVVVTDDAESGADLLLNTRSTPEVPARVVLAGNYMLTDHNHGFGETELTLRFHAVLLGVLDPHDPTAFRDAHRARRPLPTAAARVFGSDPRRLWALARRHRDSAAEQAEESLAEVPWTPSRAADFATFDGPTLAAMRSWRDRHEPGVSMFSVTSTVLHRALAAEGIDPAPTISVPFDARRFLPSDFVPLGNFAAGLDFRVGTAPTPRIVHEALTEATATGRPVANLMVNSLRIRSGLRRGIRPELPTTRPRHPRARMLFSSLRRGVDRLPWLDLDRRFYATHTAPTGPEGITFTTSTDGSFMHVVTAFHDTVFPPDLIRAALRRATAEPLGLLTGAGPRLRGEP